MTIQRRVIIQHRSCGEDYSGSGVEIREAKDGVYYCADTGDTLHVDPGCFYLSGSSNEMLDPTRTLTYRIERYRHSAGVRGPLGAAIWRACAHCATQVALTRPNRSRASAVDAVRR